MPVEQCKNGKWRVGSGSCIYETKAKAIEVYQAILASGNFSSNTISFDFDGVLDTKEGQILAKRYINEGIKVIIVTARQSIHSKEVYDIADKLGIKRSNIYFTNGKNKWELLKRLDIKTHYDNNPQQIEQINKLTNTEAKLVKYAN